MRSLLALVVSSMIVLPVFAADRTLLNDEDVWKLYTEPSAKIFDVKGRSGYLYGLGVGGILNDKFDVGIAGYALANDLTLNDQKTILVRQFEHWYAGATVGYTFNSSDLFHIRLGSLFGYAEIHTDKVPGITDGESKAGPVVEPSATLYVNLAETVEVGLGVSYRYISQAQCEDVPLRGRDFSGLTGELSVRVTEF